MKHGGVYKTDTTFSHPGGRMKVRTKKDWKKVDEIIKASPPFSCEVFGVSLLITDKIPRVRKRK